MNWKYLALAIAGSGFLFGAGAATADGFGRSLKDGPAGCSPGRFGGAYIGANVGWGHSNSKWDETEPPPPDADTPTPRRDFDNNGVVAGGQIGYNVQCGGYLFGIESDASWANLSATHTLQGVDNATGLIDPTEVDIYRDRATWFGTTRVRVGGLVHDNLLLYATGGIAYATFKHSLVDGFDVNDPGEPGLTGSGSDTRIGWTLGGGGEYAITDSISLKAEALYLGFGKNQVFAISDANAGETENFTVDDNIWVVRAGLNIKLDSLLRRDSPVEPLK